MPSVVVLVMHDITRFDRLLEAWLEAGATRATILDSVGSHQLEEKRGRDDLPLIPTLRDLLRSDDEPSKTIFSLVDDKYVEPILEATEQVLGDLSQPNRGIVFAFPVSHVRGRRL